MTTATIPTAEGTMTSSRRAMIAKCLQQTANMDTAPRVDAGLPRRGKGLGRSNHQKIVRV
jgi:hypothetical protein